MSELDPQTVLAALADLVAEETGIPAADVTAEKAFVDDLDVDSLSMMTIVVNAQEQFEVEIPDEAVTELRTVGDAVTYIVKQRAEAGQTVSQG